MGANALNNRGSLKESVYSVAFSPNGQLLASGSFDGAIKVWDVKGQKEVEQFLPEPLKLEFKEEKKKEDKKDDKDKKDKKEEKKDAKDKGKGKKEEPKEIRDNG